ncbi:tape measure protein [Enterococcus hulanensis]|uniref:tape measure protein n=1 Tax=Enterococcus hulanensis TaxID=2559929 RepID=UPI001A8D053C|nr:tape measure protein [Enterococcus hulanensis]MBO0456193.1 tape measure protein [Enterococcus hulanensis]
MADGVISIQIDADGRPIRSLNSDLDTLEGKSGKASSGIKDIVAGLGLVKVASAAFDVLKSSLDDAIVRFDTMQKYPKVMSALGFSAEDSKKSVGRLADGIDGLPTRLDTVVSTAQRMTSVTGNMNKSTDATIALNNAFLASGASTEDAKRGMEQYIQMLSTGKVDMQSWRSLQETMPIGLQKTAEAMGFVGETAQTDLYAALKDGKVTFKDFQNQLIELGTGTGELAKLAKINSEGIGTSFENLKSAVVKGLANVITALDNAAKAVTGKSIAKNIDSMKALVNKAFESMTGAIEKATPYFESFGKILSQVFDKLEPYTPAITAFVKAITTMLIIRSVGQAFSNSEIQIRLYLAAVKVAEVATKLFTLATNAQARAQLAEKVAMSVTIPLLTAKNVIMGVLTGTTSLATVATTAFSAALKVALGPIGWVTAAIGLLVAGGIALHKQLNAESEEYKKLKKSQEETVNSSQKLIDQTEKHAQDRRDEITAIDGSTKSYQMLITEIETLAAKENKTTAEKNNLKKAIEELNNSMSDLNLVYDEQRDTLSEIPTKITDQVKAFQELEKAQEAQKQMNDIIKERNDVEAKLMEINIEREKWNSIVSKSPVEAKKAAEAVQALDEKEAALKETQLGLQREFQATAAIHEEAINRTSVAVEEGVFKQQVSYYALDDTQKEVMDSMRAEYQSLEDKAGNVFDQITQKTTISMEQMIENMRVNQEAIASWGRNIEGLAEKHVDQGLLEQLRKMGPEGAAQAAELNTRSAEELQALNETYRNSSQSAMNAMKEGYELGKNGVNEEVASIMPTAKNTLVQNVKDADFGSVGKDMTDSVASKVAENKQAVADMTGKMIDDAAEVAKTKSAKADFKDIGKQIPNGMKEGINSGSKDAEDAAGKMASKLPSVAKDKLGVHSPSRVFHDIGSNVVQGMSDGISSNQEQPKNQISTMVQNMISSADGLYNSLKNIGANAVIGLANGIIDNSSHALNAAQEIANQITRTMQNALDIHSPSRVMRDKIGRFIPQGIAIGIDKDASVIDRSLERLSTNMFKGLTPELALGSSQIGATSNISRIINNTSETSKNYSPSFNFNIEHADLSNDQSIEETSRQLAVLTERQSRGRLK